jgi:hypothetical protein
MTTSPAVLLRRLASRGLRTFHGVYDLNVILERAPSRQAGSLDDAAHIVYRTPDGAWHDLCFPCTVDPGRTYLRRPINVKGTAILAAGQYPGMWRRGSHKGRPALVQVGPCTVARDPDLDETIEPGALDSGLFGINFHDDAGAGADASAGCVVADRRFVELVLGLVGEQSRNGHGDTVTVTVLDMAA